MVMFETIESYVRTIDKQTAILKIVCLSIWNSNGSVGYM